MNNINVAKTAQKPFRTVQIGLGSRGIIHIDGMLHNPEFFEIIGYCNRSEKNLRAAAERYRLSDDQLYSDAEQMLNRLHPDVMSFATMPHDRLELVRLAAKYQVKGLMFEKPVGISLKEAAEILDICNAAGIKAIVCHQHKYLASFLRLRQVIESGALGKIYQIQVQCQQHANQIATHYIDYMLWAAQLAAAAEQKGAKAAAIAAVGHAHGRFYLSDSHPSPDYILGEVTFDNGLRGLVECGYYAPQHLEHDNSFDHGSKAMEFYTDDRLTVYGETGYAWAECNGRFAQFSSQTAGKIETEEYGTFFEAEQFDAQDRYTRDFGLWLQGKLSEHPCNLKQAYEGYQILEAIYISALENRRVDLPMELKQNADCLERFETVLPETAYRKLPKALN